MWDKTVQKDQITEMSTNDEPMFELNLENALRGGVFNITIGNGEPNVGIGNGMVENQGPFLSIKNYENEKLLLQAFLMKCAAEYLGENYDESAKYLKNAFNLKQNENNDHMQYELASLLLKHKNDPEIESYLNNNQMARSSNWKLEFIMDFLKEKTENNLK